MNIDTKRLHRIGYAVQVELNNNSGLLIKAAADELDALRAEVAKSRRILYGLPQDAIDGGWMAKSISDYAKQLEAERDRLRIELGTLMRGYVGLLESGRNSILDMGGECDLVDVMEASDPWLRAARAALNEQEQRHDNQ